jgi:hypothetical protein
MIVLVELIVVFAVFNNKTYKKGKSNVKNVMKKNERSCPGKHRMSARVIRGWPRRGQRRLL